MRVETRDAGRGVALQMANTHQDKYWLTGFVKRECAIHLQAARVLPAPNSKYQHTQPLSTTAAQKLARTRSNPTKGAFATFSTRPKSFSPNLGHPKILTQQLLTVRQQRLTTLKFEPSCNSNTVQYYRGWKKKFRKIFYYVISLINNFFFKFTWNLPIFWI